MFITDEKDKKARLAVLEEIAKLMDEEGSLKRLASKKKPVAVEMSVTSVEEGKPESKDSLPVKSEDEIESRLAEKAKEKGLSHEACEDDEDDELKEQLMELYSKLK